MRILIIRHGDPDYVNDSLTPRGDREAELLAGIIDRFGIDEVFLSPQGRAQRTASYSLSRLGMSGTTLKWLHEFVPLIRRPDRDPVKTIAWDWRPSDWTVHPEFFDKDRWFTNEIMTAGGVEEEFVKVREGLDELLSRTDTEETALSTGWRRATIRRLRSSATLEWNVLFSGICSIFPRCSSGMVLWHRRLPSRACIRRSVFRELPVSG